MTRLQPTLRGGAWVLEFEMPDYTVNIRIKVHAHSADHASKVADCIADKAKEIARKIGASIEGVTMPIRKNDS